MVGPTTHDPPAGEPPKGWRRAHPGRASVTGGESLQSGEGASGTPKPPQVCDRWRRAHLQTRKFRPRVQILAAQSQILQCDARMVGPTVHDPSAGKPPKGWRQAHPGRASVTGGESPQSGGGPSGSTPTPPHKCKCRLGGNILNCMVSLKQIK